MTSISAFRDEMPRPYRWLILAAFVLVTLLIGWASGIVTASKIPTWYAGLAKPWFTPPRWAFPVAWTLLYVMMAVAAWRIWSGPASPARRQALGWYAVQLVFNALWTPAFFGAESPALGLAVIVPLWISVLMTLRRFGAIDRAAGWMFVPYLAWVSYATLLNATILVMNR